MWARGLRLALPFAALLILFVCGAREVDARPGGGHSFSGGSSRSYSGGGYSGGSSSRSSYSGHDFSSHDRASRSGGGGGGEFSTGGVIAFCVMLGVGFPAALIIMAKQMYSAEYSSGARSGHPPAQLRDVLLREIREVDESFSEVLMNDFVFGLAARSYGSSATELEALSPYLSEQARAHIGELCKGGQAPTVVIGSVRDTDVQFPNTIKGDRSMEVWYELELNLKVGDESHYLKERWLLVRDISVVTRAPEGPLAFHCPNCAAPFEEKEPSTCAYCGEKVDSGRFDWYLRRAETLSSESSVGGLTHYAPEEGTSWRTVVDPSASRLLRELRSEDPQFDMGEFKERAGMIMRTLNEAWSEQELGKVRGLITESMCGYLEHGLLPYQEQGLVNVIEGLTIKKTELAKVARDAHFDAIVLRIWARSLDYVKDASSGAVRGGSVGMPRSYSEYWTFIRGRGVRGKAGTTLHCPNCGAELQISNAGNCEFCKVHVSSGEFDWVLSKIEQDDVYVG